MLVYRAMGGVLPICLLPHEWPLLTEKGRLKLVMMCHRLSRHRRRMCRTDALRGITVLHVTVGWRCASRVTHDLYGFASGIRRLIVLHL